MHDRIALCVYLLGLLGSCMIVLIGFALALSEDIFSTSAGPKCSLSYLSYY